MATLVFGAGIVGGGFVIGRHVDHRPEAVAPRTSVTATPIVVPPATPTPNSSPAAVAPIDLSKDFADLQQQVGAQIGLVAVGVGNSSGSPVTLGDLPSPLPAWSTSKVPLVIASLRQRNSVDVDAEMTKAITESDNAAAESIWAALGPPAEAAKAVQDVLAEAGDTTTAVPAVKSRPEYTAFGQTMWSLTAQARFVASAACDKRDSPVFTLMGSVEGDQRWGLGIIPESKFKGGWGPEEQPAGHYLVRQMGVIPTPSGMSAVTIAALPTSGSFDDGIAALDKIAQWITGHLAELPTGRCPAEP